MPYFIRPHLVSRHCDPRFSLQSCLHKSAAMASFQIRDILGIECHCMIHRRRVSLFTVVGASIFVSGLRSQWARCFPSALSANLRLYLVLIRATMIGNCSCTKQCICLSLTIRILTISSSYICNISHSRSWAKLRASPTSSFHTGIHVLGTRIVCRSCAGDASRPYSRSPAISLAAVSATARLTEAEDSMCRDVTSARHAIGVSPREKARRA
mmetsp:Transcript_50827/g.80552  ORF Transcript_50827/g.80552 Transcript_50827/m.80552 type:complete len:212 (-) Transcript_50827:12-647(-)